LFFALFFWYAFKRKALDLTRMSVYRKRNERIRDVCQREQAKLNRTFVEILVDREHKLAYCRHGKVKKSNRT